jgi:hypothetical protein
MDIDTQHRLTVSVKLKNHRNAHYKFYINDVEFKQADEVVVHFDLLESLHFKIELSDFNSAVEVCDISINGRQVMPLYLHHASPPTNWIENIPLWEYNISSPFYAWYQEISGGGWIA